MSVVDIIIPTFNNHQYLIPCVSSLLGNRSTIDLFRLIIVNNGHPETMAHPVLKHPDVTILQMKENLGWEGALKSGLAASSSPYVVFANDDILIPTSSRLWANQMLQHFRFPDCAAVGPASNCVAGMQSIFAEVPYSQFRVSFLVGFFMMLKRSALEEAGGVDDSLPNHGDDIDLSIRIRKTGKYLVADRDVFIYHHGFKTGAREFGAYWNSVDMSERTSFSLINKHGLTEWFKTWSQQYRSDIPTDVMNSASRAGELERDLVRKYVSGEKVLEIGCGPKKTVDWAVGVDIIPEGEEIPGLFHEISKADVVADVSSPLPVPEASFDCVIARHILEHMVDPVQAIQIWGKPIVKNGKLIIAVPDETRNLTIPMNHEHKHTFTPESLARLMESLGWKTEAIEDSGNFISFVGVFSKNGKA